MQFFEILMILFAFGNFFKSNQKNKNVCIMFIFSILRIFF